MFFLELISPFAIVIEYISEIESSSLGMTGFFPGDIVVDALSTFLSPK